MPMLNQSAFGSFQSQKRILIFNRYDSLAAWRITLGNYFFSEQNGV